MKGVIIGSDLLEHNGDVKFIETNTNTTIYTTQKQIHGSRLKQQNQEIQKR